ncbi:hypothetical protein [Ferrimonas kyonanensis]|uniref:hypothetical protein n=1 Tax=Ferrimonas kyonanensis TaxID=364763 RepID=UPI000412274E|nr:hypothetical protein [Ferrimonas kyonanensis]
MHEAKIQALFDEANRRCGLSYELCLDFFNLSVDHYLKSIEEGERPAVVALAKKLDYQSPEERINELDEGECIHHLPVDCCPLGCGEY